jgi:hypothetical protein
VIHEPLGLHTLLPRAALRALFLISLFSRSVPSVDDHLFLDEQATQILSMADDGQQAERWLGGATTNPNEAMKKAKLKMMLMQS